MAIEAPISKFKKNNLKIIIVVLLVFAVWCAYDGYFNKAWIQDHTDADGNAGTYLVVNRHAPLPLLIVSIVFGVYFFAIKDKKMTAEDNQLIVSRKKTIAYDSIESVDKTYFESKGYFILRYKQDQGKLIKLKVSDRKYDNLDEILDYIVSKIS